MIVLTLLILGIAFFQIIQGLFSAMIMLILTILASAIAFNWYEPLAGAVAGNLGAYAPGAALLALFVVTLFVFREVLDRVIRGNVVLGVWADRIGGGGFGLLTGLLLVGMLTIIMQMLPFGPSLLGYQPYDSQFQEADAGPPRWAADFTLGLMKTLSAGSLQPIPEAAKSLENYHRDLLLESFAARNRPEGATPSAKPGSFTVPEAFDLGVLVDVNVREQEGVAFKGDKATRDRLAEHVPQYPLTKMKTSKLYVLRTTVASEARDEIDGWLRLPATQFRLHGSDGEDYYPVAYLTYCGGWRVNAKFVEKDSKPTDVADVGNLMVARLMQNTPLLTVDWVYRIPEKVAPEFVTFRQTQAVDMPALLADLPKANVKGVQVALGVMPKTGQVNFPPTARFFQPSLMQAGSSLVDVRIMYLDKSNLPPQLPKIVQENGRIQSVIVSGSLQSLANSVPRGTPGESAGSYMTVNAQTQVVQVVFKVDPTLAPPNLALLLAQMKPQLMLGSGQLVCHRGAAVIYELSGDTNAYLYYEWRRPDNPGTLEPDLVRAFTNNLSGAKKFVLVFHVPAQADGMVSGLTLGLGKEYEYYPDAPLSSQASGY
jgi:uncharacterized membrane protein required for colicin V production